LNLRNLLFLRGVKPTDPALLPEKMKVDWVVKLVGVRFENKKGSPPHLQEHRPGACPQPNSSSPKHSAYFLKIYKLKSLISPTKQPMLKTKDYL
jgi:hypothetical protein